MDSDFSEVWFAGPQRMVSHFSSFVSPGPVFQNEGQVEEEKDAKAETQEEENERCVSSCSRVASQTISCSCFHFA